MGCACGGCTGTTGYTTLLSERVSPDQIDLSIVEQQLLCKGWKASEVWETEKGYKSFLKQFLNVSLGNQLIPPSQKVDDFWHQHILNTEKYEQDCKAVFGSILHHVPTDKNKIPEERVKERAMLLSSLQLTQNYENNLSDAQNELFEELEQELHILTTQKLASSIIT